MEQLNKILNSDRYIPYYEYKRFCEENNIETNKELLEQTNKKFIDKKLIEYKEYFDNIFTDVGKNINLDEEQRKIILTDDDYCLINAGAGSGKSTTMAGKVKYLVDKLGIKPEEIIMLSFTKKSSEDLDEKVNDLLELGIPVSTFHSLGMRFIKKFYPYPIQVVGEDEQKSIICNYIKEIFKDKNKLRQLIDLFKEYDNKSYIFNGFIENFEKFDTFEEYFEDYKKRKYQKEAIKQGGIHQYIINRLDKNDLFYTIQGEKLKSIAEVKIANFLYINGLEYSYEKLYEHKVNEDTTYQPDFTLEYQGKKIYIEYFGLSNCYNEKNELIKKEVDRYNKIRRKKEKFQNGTKDDFINLDYKTVDGYFLETLKRELLNRGIKFERKSDDEIFYRIIDNTLDAEFFNLIKLVIKFIETFKNMLIDETKEEYMFDKRITEIQNEEFKYICYSTDKKQEAKCRIKALELLREIYKYYQKYLFENHMIDYADMICLCYRQIIKEVKNKWPEFNYKYIIVDEYQDITFQRFLFIKSLVEYFDAKLISVGDDWQSIYAFTGSRLEFFNRFKEYFLDAKDDLLISTTYRYGQELVDITSEFIKRNEEQSRKEIKAIKKLENPIEICEYTDDTECEEINKIVHKLYKENPNDNILILARTNDCLKKIGNCEYFISGIDDILISKDLPSAKIEALTIHRSKGLTADQVIVFGLKESLFPSKGKISHWIFEYFSLDSIKDEMPFAEERRLFYVALTRTKNKVYLVVPNKGINKSQFVDEIEKIIREDK